MYDCVVAAIVEDIIGFDLVRKKLLMKVHVCPYCRKTLVGRFHISSWVQRAKSEVKIKCDTQ